jgi:hypothetical protein
MTLAASQKVGTVNALNKFVTQSHLSVGAEANDFDAWHRDLPIFEHTSPRRAAGSR